MKRVRVELVRLKTIHALDSSISHCECASRGDSQLLHRHVLDPGDRINIGSRGRFEESRLAYRWAITHGDGADD